MKEKVAIFVTLLIVGLFVPIISYASTSTFTPNYIQTNDFIAYTSINAATITLANGQVISNAVVTGGSSNETQTIMNDIDIILIIDTSGSMGGTIESVKSAAIQLSERFYENFENARIALISFESNATLQTDFTKDKSLLKGKINGLDASGGTSLHNALRYVERLSFSQEADAKRTIITLTDGATEGEQACRDAYKKFYDEKYLIYNISLGGDYIGAFIDETNTPIGRLYTNVDISNLNNIYNEIYDNIYEEFVNTTIDSNFNFECDNGFCLGNNTYFTLDDELAQGALLTVEYIFDIKPNFNCTQISIMDTIGDNFCYSPESKLLTENGTNASQGWKYNDNDSTKIYYYKNGSASNYAIKKYSDFKIKIVLTRLLAASSNKDNVFKNTIDFAIKGKDYRGNDKYYSTLTSGQSFSTLDSAIYVIPPLGLKNDYANMILIVLIIILITIMICNNNVKKELNFYKNVEVFKKI